jgi:sterol 3beta-glucosyltransferase
VTGYWWPADRRLTQLGVAPAPIPFAKLTADRLGTAIRDAVTRSAFRTRAQTLARLIAPQDGAAAMVEAVNRLAE